MVTKIRDLPTSAASVTDLDGIGIQGSDSAQNISPAFKGTGAMLGRMNSGADALDDTVTLCDPDDNTKLGRFDLGSVPTGTTMVWNFARKGLPIETRYSAGGTHTFNVNSTYFQIEAVGGGGGGGACDGQGGVTYGSGAGGGSGFYGSTLILARPGTLLTGTVVIGAAGTAGAVPSGNGGNGGDTTWSDGTNSFTWGGGKLGEGMVAANTPYNKRSGVATKTGSIIGYANRGEAVVNNSPSPDWLTSDGGSCPFGDGGKQQSGGSGAVAGVAGSGFGAGGSGGATSATTSNAAGGAGSGGYLIVREW